MTQVSAQDKAEAAMKLAKQYQELEELAIEKKKKIAEFESRKEVIKQEIIRLSDIIKSGIEV